MRLFAAALLVASAHGYAPSAMPLAVRAARPVAAAVVMQEPAPKAVTIGSAWVGGLLGIYLSGELSTGVVFAIAFAYGSTLPNKFGEVTSKAGEIGAKVYDKTLDLNDQYDIVPKAKSAIDTTVTVASNLDKSYGITSKIDEQLKLSAAVDNVKDKVEEVKGSITSKVDDLKSKASSS